MGLWVKVKRRLHDSVTEFTFYVDSIQLLLVGSHFRYDNEAIILTRSGNMKTGHSYTLGPEIVPLNQRQNGNGSLIISNMHSLEMRYRPPY